MTIRNEYFTGKEWHETDNKYKYKPRYQNVKEAKLSEKDRILDIIWVH